MARSIADINNIIVTNLVNEFANIGVTINPLTWSRRNVLRNICYSFAIVQNLAEQLQDFAIVQMLDIQSKSIAGTKQWLQFKMFQFQYSATDPQNLTIVNGVPAYPTTNTALQIIKGCSVNTTSNNNVIIKVAKGNPLTALGTSEKSAAQGYINQIGTAGIVYQVVSLPADKLIVDADVYYNGTYSAVIEQAVIDALNNFLTTLAQEKFDGFLYALDIERTIRGVEGVNDVVISQLSARQDSQPVGGGIDLILGNDLLVRRYQAYAGYIVQETTTNYTFADTLNFIPE